MKITWIEQEILAVGGIPVSTENAQTLKDAGISAIITLTEQPLDGQQALAGDVLPSMGFELLHVPVVDQHPPTPQQVKTVYEFLQRKRSENRAVYLHCHAGVGRTGTMLHAIYLLAGMDLEAAKALVKSTRPSSQFFLLSDTQKAFLEAIAVKLS